jgi:large subunit ribosomal protein L29
MKAQEITNLSVEELARREAEFRQEMLNLRVQQASGQLENPARIKVVRRSIARIQTALTSHRRAPAAS